MATTQPVRKVWWQRTDVIVGASVLLVLIVVLFFFGGGSYSFTTDARADPDQKFDWAYFFALSPLLLKALWITVQATLGGFAIAVVLGLFLAVGRRSHRRILSWPVTGFIEFVRSTPLLVQLYFLFFALPEYDIVLSPNVTLMLGLGIHYGCYCSEAYRAGINSVPVGQWEAATALNLSPVTKWSKVVLPQAVPNILPALGNYLIAGFKDAPLGSTIQVTGVLFFARTISNRAFRPVEAFTLVGVGFLLVSIPAAYLLRRLEKRIAYERI